MSAWALKLSQCAMICSDGCQYLKSSQLPVQLAQFRLLCADQGLLLAKDDAELVHLLDVGLRGVDLTRRRSVNIPESSLLAIKNLPFLLISFFRHLIISMRFSGCSLQGQIKKCVLTFACASACININSHFLENIFCNLARFSAS